MTGKRISPNETLIPGFHGVHEALTQGHPLIREIWMMSGKRSRRVNAIVQMARRKGIPVSLKNAAQLSRHLPGVVHQGIVAVAETFTYSDLDPIIEASLHGDGYGLVVVSDHITDQGNLGSLIRTSAFFGSHGIIIPADRSARIGPDMLKRSAGSYLHIPIARVVNITRTLELLAKKGFWIIGTSGGASTSIYCFDWRRHVALILGSEQKGISRAARKACHEVVSIPSQGMVESLNVSVSAGAILSEILRQRNG